MDVAVAVRGLTKSYAGRRVVDDVSFEVATGSVWALLGPNGAGKTTTVECLEGYRRPDAGDVRVLGLDPVRDHDALSARVGVVLQDGGAYQASTPRELLRLYARFYRDPLRPDDLLDQLGLQRAARTRVRHLSGGERKRLDMALALVGRPQLLILDEPTAGMDAEVRRETWGLLRALREQGTTVLLTTHLVDEAERLADRVAILARGRLLVEGSPAALVAQHGAGGLLVTTPADVDAAALARDLGAAIGVPVRVEAAGRLRIDAPAADVARLLAEVPRWFADRGLPLGGVVAGGDGLEGVVLALAARGAGTDAEPPA